MAVCVGCGLKVNSESGLLEVELRPGGGIACDPDGSDAGLYVSNPNLVGSNCIEVSGSTISINPSESAGNGIVCRSDGLYAPCPDSIVGVSDHLSPQNGSVVDVAGITDPYSSFNWNSNAIEICNPLACTIAGSITFQAGCLEGDLLPGDAAFSELYVDSGFGTTATSPCSVKWVSNTGSTNQRVDFNNMNETNYLVLDAGVCQTFVANLRLNILNGSAIDNLTNGVRWEIKWTLVQTGCC